MISHSIKTGLSFTLGSGIITSLATIVGLYSSTHSKLAIVGGLLAIAIGDSLSDALGIHFSEEAEAKHTPKEIWQATFSTAFFKFFFASIFLIPILIFNFPLAIYACLFLGFFILFVFSFYLAKAQKLKPKNVIFEHLFFASIAVFFCYFLGNLISKVFSQ